jgi:hypothetical protein
MSFRPITLQCGLLYNHSQHIPFSTNILTVKWLTSQSEWTKGFQQPERSTEKYGKFRTVLQTDICWSQICKILNGVQISHIYHLATVFCAAEAFPSPEDGLYIVAVLISIGASSQPDFPRAGKEITSRQSILMDFLEPRVWKLTVLRSIRERLRGLLALILRVSSKMFFLRSWRRTLRCGALSRVSSWTP